jgi:hypothetical protein
MKNPFYINITWLGIIVIITSILLLFFSSECNDCICVAHISSKTENILIGIFASSLLLLFNEIVQLISDKKNYDYLKGEYKRTIIADVIEKSDIVKNEKRAEELNEEQIKEFEKRGLRPIPGSHYLEILPYREIGKDWRITLKYLHNGIYDGTADYHKYWENFGEKTTVKFTLTLNKSNLTTGSGNYKYMERDDYGIYSFQMNATNKNEILVTYKNTIPSGLAEGYEKWERI